MTLGSLDSIRPACRSYVEALQEDQWLWPWFGFGMPFVAAFLVIAATVRYAWFSPVSGSLAFVVTCVVLWCWCVAFFLMSASLAVCGDVLVRWAWEQRQ